MSVKLFCSSLLTAGAAYLVYNKYSTDNLHAEQISIGIEKATLKTPARIAVIGTGIGGSSASYFLSQAFGSSVQLDVYEKADRIGGRMRVIELNGEEMEAGGAVVHDSNKYMKYFTKEMGLEELKVIDDTSRLGIYDGKEFLYLEGTNKIMNTIKLLWRYGPLSLYNLDSSLTKMLKDFTNVYTLQDNDNAYETVPELLKAMGGDSFVDYTLKTAREVMRENGLGDLLIDELVTGVCRTNYGQDTNVNAFTGYVSMAGGTEGKLWAVKGGNHLVCEKLLKTSKANIFFKKKIVSIQKDKDEHGKVLYFLDTGDEYLSVVPYDAVIVAAPLEVPKCYFDCSECSNWPNQANLGRYQQTIATFIQAYVNYTSFGFNKLEDCPDTIFTTETDHVKFSSLGSLTNTKGEIIEPPCYKIFSREELSKETLGNLFNISKGETKVKSYNWLAYPHYTPPERFTSFKLDEGVFYVNSIERAASAMEMSAIGGRNAALLTKKYLMSSGQN